MQSTHYPCNENRDLYLELLKKAEKEADRALVQMIRAKLQAAPPLTETTGDGCQILAFPGASVAAPGPAPEHLFWKSSAFWHVLVQFIAFLSFGIGWFIFFCSLVTNEVIR
jgi:hypothetical protein